MPWRFALLVVTVAALALAGGALYLHQVDEYPLHAIPPANPRATAAESCSNTYNSLSQTFVWSAPDGQSFPTRRPCVDYVLAHHESSATFRPERLRIYAHNRREREVQWLVFAAVALVVLFIASALLYWRRPVTA